MATEEEKALISPCGIYCGVCPMYLARTDEGLRRKMAEGQGVAVEQVAVCEGCRPSQGRPPFDWAETACETFTCATGDKGVEFCYQCDGFPCLKLAPCADRAQELPHNTKVYGLVLLQKEGADAWIERYPGRIRQYRRGKKPVPGGDIQS